MTDLQTILIEQWYQPKMWGWLLWPLAQIFQYIVKIRQYCYAKNIFRSYKADVPVIVVGNLTVGGTGKTPLVIYLAELLQQQGLQPGIVLRGYKSKAIGAVLVHTNSDPKLVGDEAVLLARRCTCPIVVAKQRVQGVKLLQAQHVKIIICDDGLQHYALQRDLEIAVIDGIRKFGNGYCLPMGPLRELPERLNQVALTIVNGTDMQILTSEVYWLLNSKRKLAINSFIGKTVHAIAGIGMPQKFFQQLRNLDITVIPHAFPDHHAFKMSDINFADRLPVLMTEKDAVKCSAFATDQHWAVPISIVLTADIKEKFCSLMQEIING